MAYHDKIVQVNLNDQPELFTKLEQLTDAFNKEHGLNFSTDQFAKKLLGEKLKEN